MPIHCFFHRAHCGGGGSGQHHCPPRCAQAGADGQAQLPRTGKNHGAAEKLSVPNRGFPHFTGRGGGKVSSGGGSAHTLPGGFDGLRAAPAGGERCSPVGCRPDTGLHRCQLFGDAVRELSKEELQSAAPLIFVFYSNGHTTASSVPPPFCAIPFNRALPEIRGFGRMLSAPTVMFSGKRSCPARAPPVPWESPDIQTGKIANRRRCPDSRKSDAVPLAVPPGWFAAGSE